MPTPARWRPTAPRTAPPWTNGCCASSRSTSASCSQLVEEEISIAEARRLGISATDEEVKVRILAIPSFQENGQFIGYDRYRQMLQMQNPPVRESDFEEQVRRSITVEKLQAALTNWISIPDSEIEAEFRKRNEKVKLAVVNFPADKFREGRPGVRR